MEQQRQGRAYWFAAKRYGWGWGLPLVWQGWVVLAAFFVLLAAGAWFCHPERSPWPYLIYTTLLSILLIAVCWRKGEPPSWRWGDKQ